MKGAGKPGKQRRAKDAGKIAAAERAEGPLRESTDKYSLLIDATIPVEINATVQPGPPARIFAVCRDITERKGAEEALRRSEARYRMLYEGTPVMMHSIDAEGRLVSVSDHWLRTLGYAREEVLGRRSTEFLDERSREYARSVVLPEFMRTGVCTDVPYTFVARSGARISTLLSAIAERDESGKFARSLAVIIDVTERLRVEEALRKNERMLQTIIDTGPECIKLTDRESCILLMNRAGLKMVGADSIDQVRGRPICELVAPEHRASFLALTAEVFAGGSGTLEFRFTGLQGRELWLETTAVPLRDEQGEVTALLGVTRDVTERKRAEEALLQSEERFRDLAESLPLTVFEIDLQGRFTYANRAALEKFGYSPQDMAAGVSISQVLAAADRERALAILSLRLAGGEAGYNEYLGLRKNGSTFPMTVASNPILRDGHPVGLRGFALDLTERKELEAERMKADKLESIGTLAGGIAHDFNNLLQGVFGYISLAKLEIDDRAKALANLEQTEKALHTSVALAAQLLTFSKGGKPVRRPIDLRPVIENACRFSLSGSHTGCRLALDDGLWSVEADEGQIAQVIQNVVLNADQAMPQGGTVEVAAQNLPAGDPRVPAGLPPARYVKLSIADRGIGIPAGLQARIFDPYFTTKERGSGLGLATSYAIARNHGGLITVRSTQGEGSTFEVYLPASGEQARQAPGAEVTAPRRSGRFLVMDDDAVVLSVAGELLRALGHEAVLTAHGEEAVERYREAMAAGRPFDAVILDLTVRGGLGGQETVRRLQRIDPGVRAVVSSGYSEDAVTSHYREHGFRAYLRKPYTAAQLNETLNALFP